jgi:hypothetical protein
MTDQFARTSVSKCDALLTAQAGSATMRIWATDLSCTAPPPSCSVARATADRSPRRPLDRDKRFPTQGKWGRRPPHDLAPRRTHLQMMPVGVP